MNDRLHEIIAQVAILHEHFENRRELHNLELIEKRLEEVDEDVKEHYLTLLMQYYFQSNDLVNLQALLLQGFKFDMRFEDIKEAFIHIQSEENVIEFFEDQVVMLKDEVDEVQLEQMYNYYHKHPLYQIFLKTPLNLIKRNRYVCAKAYKSQQGFAKFFLNEDLLESLQKDMPFLLK